MLLKAIRIIQWLIGIFLFVYGVYLIFGVQEFFGTLAIIAAFLIFPSLEKKDQTAAAASKSYSNDPYHASAFNSIDSDESDDNDNGNSDNDNDGDYGGDSNDD
ncbi:hypothetical protein [Neobacillus sp. PS2-9]|jgi:hypothetical protein|uniref:hypothetical protein n=1 Tax=Neobacillus sp. PS2-9 TaxID=3070676 RepID=UPI0027E07F4B|nr:hypothetical protein [Neobacillus sp. PS2-9]WML58985.1 hypothetical protein RCG25_04065 [Neobacillus sp. PS2-9]